MTQSNFNLPNTDGATFRSDNNTAHQAHATWSSGNTAPGTTYPYQVWIDTANGLLKRRNASNTAWITEGRIDGSNPQTLETTFRSPVATLSDLQSIGTGNLTTGNVRYMRGRTSDNDGGEGVFVWDGSDLSTEVGNDPQSAVYVAPDTDTSGTSGAWVRSYSGPALAAWFGAPASGDARSELQAMIDWGSTTGNPVAVDRPYDVNGGLYLKSNVEIEWLLGASIKMTGSSGVGAFLTGDFSGGVPAAAIENVSLYNPVVDANDQPGENGIAVPHVYGLFIYHPIVKNTLFDPSTLGGRAFQFEGETVENIHVWSPRIEDCTIGINSQATTGTTADRARHINFYDVVMHNVDVPFNFDGQDTPPPSSYNRMSIVVDGVSLFNCGRLTFSGATATDGAIITGDRGFGCVIRDLRLVNDDSYGTVGSFVNGKIFELNIKGDCLLYADFTTGFDHSTRRIYSASVAAIASTVFTDEVVFVGSVSSALLVAENPSSLGAYLGSGLYQISADPANVGIIVDTNAATFDTARLILTDRTTHNTSPALSASDVNAAGNRINLVQTDQKITRAHRAKRISEGTGVDFFRVSLPNSGRVMARVSVYAASPSSASTAFAVAAEYLVTATRGGDGVFTSGVTEIAKQVSLDGYTSAGLIVSATDNAGTDVDIVVRQSNNAGADAGVTVVLEIVSADGTFAQAANVRTQ